VSYLRQQPESGRLVQQHRREQLIRAALPLAEKHGFERVTRNMVAAAAGCSASLISAYWTAPNLQTAIMEEAVRVKCLRVIAQGLASNHPAALGAPFEVRKLAAASLV
jgi:AcrR family transcriptional regulator